MLTVAESWFRSGYCSSSQLNGHENDLFTCEHKSLNVYVLQHRCHLTQQFVQFASHALPEAKERLNQQPISEDGDMDEAYEARWVHLQRRNSAKNVLALKKPHVLISKQKGCMVDPWLFDISMNLYKYVLKDMHNL